jgi:hypothetical protein
VPCRSFGQLSVRIAVAIFVAATVLLVGFYQIPDKASWHGVAAGAVVIAVGIVAPLGHLVGLVLGVMAIFRTGDRRVLGLIGALLNLVVVAIGIFLVYMAASGLAPR